MTEDQALSTLLLKRQELVSEIRSYAAQLAIHESENDPLDRVQSMNRREQAVTMIDRLSSIMFDIDGALRAISEETYGICSDCEESIAIKRLKTVPWASRCVQCQERVDSIGAIAAAA
jgi:DnaK suppressor protein